MGNLIFLSHILQFLLILLSSLRSLLIIESTPWLHHCKCIMRHQFHLIQIFLFSQFFALFSFISYLFLFSYSTLLHASSLSFLIVLILSSHKCCNSSRNLKICFQIIWIVIGTNWK